MAFKHGPDTLADIHGTTEAVLDNLASWNDRADVHANGGYGDLGELVHDPDAVTGVAKRDYDSIRPFLPNASLEGLKLLHLQCHIGTDTLCWPRLGAAEVWGLDFSPTALEYARRLADKAHVDVTYVESDARFAADAPELAGHLGTFDAIVTSAGTITWLPELDEWARSIERLLTPGGIFMIRDDHPLLSALGFSGTKIVSDYKTGSISSYDMDVTYVTDPHNESSEQRLAHTKNHNWSHDFQEIVEALTSAGLSIEALREDEVAEWQSLPILEFHPEDESWRMPAALPRIPLMFSIVARKSL